MAQVIARLTWRLCIFLYGDYVGKYAAEFSEANGSWNKPFKDGWLQRPFWSEPDIHPVEGGLALHERRPSEGFPIEPLL